MVGVWAVGVKRESAAAAVAEVERRSSVVMLATDLTTQTAALTSKRKGRGGGD
jgi:hypothetical protein